MTFDDFKRLLEELRARSDSGGQALIDVAAAEGFLLLRGRHRLANARGHEAYDLAFRGRLYVVGVGRFENGALAEVFIDAAKQSTDAADDARDAALCLSLALQYGCPAETIRNAATRDGQGAPAGLIGAVLDMLAEDGGEAAR